MGVDGENGGRWGWYVGIVGNMVTDHTDEDGVGGVLVNKGGN